MGKNGAESVKAVALGHNKGSLTKFIERILACNIKIDKLKADRMNVYNEADDMGYDRKELGAIIKIKMKPIELAYKRGVNQMCLELGLPEEYNLTPEQIALIEGRTQDDEAEQEGEAA